MIVESYCSFDVSKLLKEKGFDEEIETLIRPDETRYYLDQNSVSRMSHSTIRNSNINIYSDDVSCPTHQMAIKWLREVHKIHITVGYTFKADANLADNYVSYCFEIENAKTLFYYARDEWYNTYEEACEVAIKYCLTELL